MRPLDAGGDSGGNDQAQIRQLANLSGSAAGETDCIRARFSGALHGAQHIGTSQEVEMPTAMSPGRHSVSSWRTKADSKPKSFATAVSTDVSVVGGIEQRACRWRDVAGPDR